MNNTSSAPVRWRFHEQANRTEREIVSLIVYDLFSEAHQPEQIEDAVFTRQYLFPEYTEPQYLILIPTYPGRYTRFYIALREVDDSTVIIGDNDFDGRPLILHKSWIINEARVLSSYIEDYWVDYVYHPSLGYVLVAPGMMSIGTDRRTAKRAPLKFSRQYSALRDFELDALGVVKQANGDFYSDDEIRSLRVSSQYLATNPVYGKPDVLFRIEGGQPIAGQFVEIAISEGRGFRYGGNTGTYEYEHDLSVLHSDSSNGYKNLFVSYLDSEGETETVVYDGQRYRAVVSSEPRSANAQIQLQQKKKKQN
ncbi:hypothetical protein [Rhizobium leguminosarum]|uniref:hypothetical protein n=1 Tax=Rhizobium leguminosarum TaxID=384 RepID=UPI001C94C018|nr:hypothetical protein [Rhizobium leguminosarum]MBY5565117.1 hypothetical protein [Rhizobium leguminosarum]MBY5714374.1 hypothetical protein [Rhizobium leguminosarum]